MASSRFENILGNLHFLDNTKDDKWQVTSDKGYQFRSLMNYFHQSHSNSASNDDFQSIDKYMVKLTGRSSMKQYVKNKEIKLVFNIWYCWLVTQDTSINLTCTLYFAKIENVGENLERSVVLKITEYLQNSHCQWKLYERDFYVIDTAWRDKKGMLEMSVDRKTKRDDFELLSLL